MKTYSDRPVPTYVTIGSRLHIHFNEHYEQRQDDMGSRDVYSYDEAVCRISDDRDTIIDKIYAVSDDMEQAMELADGWFAQG